MHQLAQHQQECRLIALSRSGIDHHSFEGFVPGLSDELLLLQYWSEGNVVLYLALSLALGIASMAGLIGMFLFKSWGRTTALATTVVFTIVMFVPGNTVLSWLDYVLTDLFSMLWGAILALAYFSPVSSLFSSTRPSA
ncbi:hypothetical protein INH39_13285 [Massilia violaceinigra]|uniref:Uncharacterized protein n=1 Tax=Massilia violaceinigra TaxID=2045208 RepID=A0ABY4AFV8_9BURK|nr:hypothetical protein [Massilia violaceinigra]UOD32534.1 hypothetical protein INH39_13285 [Massilia violaceinigra]